MTENRPEPIRVFLCGDVMTGRGIDQALPHPGRPVLSEPAVRDARRYRELAELAHGPIPWPVGFGYVWGDALAELERTRPDVRIINLETSVTANEEPWPEKRIHYRMHPRNVGCLTAAQIDCCCLANNHTLDWGYRGLTETLETLDQAGILHAGAGRDAEEASAPVVLDVPDKGRLLVFAFASTSSGVPWQWRAAPNHPGVRLLEDLSEETVHRIGSGVHQLQRPGDVTLASIHWGNNWGYDIPTEQVRFAHRLIEEGIDIVHGHSSHHVKAMEVYRERPILYGCGDFLTDYEGISGHEAFRGDLTLMYLLDIEPGQGRLVRARLVPLQVRRFRLNRASEADVGWLCDLLNAQGAPFGTGVQREDDNRLTLHWPGAPREGRAQPHQ
jgi:poly-gamma-glutamate synthesis protein (capsule biosynthesis protein)